jgi:two-component system response regulator YesN
MRYKFILGNGKVLKSGDIPSSTYNQEVDFNSMYKDIKFLLNSGCSGDIHIYVDELFKHGLEIADENIIRRLCLSAIMCIVFVLNENNENLDSIVNDINLVWERLLKFETIADVRSWLENLFLSINGQLSRKANSKYRMIVDEIKRYIEKNYMNCICIDTIADELNYSPNYLSYVFKKESGDTIADYITKIKMEKAKEMLLDLRNKIYNISEILGFSNAAYFCSVFKKVTSMTPNEYREKHKLRK